MATILQFYRAGNALISAIATLLGYWIGGISPLNPQPWPCVLAMILLTAFANSHNDLVDFEVDKINRPDSPLPSGRISHRNGMILAWGGLVGALTIGMLVSIRHFVTFCLMGGMLWLYNKFLKGLPLVGNLWVAFLTMSPLWVASLDTGWLSALWPPMLFAFLLSFARELIKDIEDLSGDQALGLRTFPILSGVADSKHLSQMLLLLTVLLLPLPVWTMTYDRLFILFCGVLVVPALAAAVLALKRERWKKAQTWVKLGMLGGILSALATLHAS